MTTSNIDQVRHTVQPVARPAPAPPANRDVASSPGRDARSQVKGEVRSHPLAPVSRRQSSTRSRAGVSTPLPNTAEGLVESYVRPPPEDMSLVAGPACLGLLDAIVAEIVPSLEGLPGNTAAILAAERDQRRDLLTRLYAIGGAV
ncbi:hypothetical protein [Chelatococcus sp. XZ-Ab1]|uniref:hypothetical protein n=1 Tax=Chelatococcus sp. XZ-Ab1 TaxID=3034027 RepID=UPI0023E38C73|nr:hypothetical protein [Chelatococcus sp. XZ-Ab1]